MPIPADNKNLQQDFGILPQVWDCFSLSGAAISIQRI
jgi:hypothetical protein